MGRLLADRGAWDESKNELYKALEYFEKMRPIQSQGIVRAYQALQYLLFARSSQAPSLLPSPALDATRLALIFADEREFLVGHSNVRDYVRTNWLLGASYLTIGDVDTADNHLSEALDRCRGINLVEMEAIILLESANVRVTTGERNQALHLELIRKLPCRPRC